MWQSRCTSSLLLKSKKWTQIIFPALKVILSVISISLRKSTLLRYVFFCLGGAEKGWMRSIPILHHKNDYKKSIKGFFADLSFFQYNDFWRIFGDKTAIPLFLYPACYFFLKFVETKTKTRESLRTLQKRKKVYVNFL